MKRPTKYPRFSDVRKYFAPLFPETALRYWQTVCPENGDTLVSVAIVFPTEKTMPLTIEIPQDVYTALKELSLSTRRSMEEICGDIIKEQLLSDNDNNHV